MQQCIIDVSAVLRLLFLSYCSFNLLKGFKRLVKSANIFLNISSTETWILLACSSASAKRVAVVRIKPRILAASPCFIHQALLEHVFLFSMQQYHVATPLSLVPKGVRKYNTNTWLERGSDTVGCHCFNQSSFHYLLAVLAEKNTLCCRKVMIFQQPCVFLCLHSICW